MKSYFASFRHNPAAKFCQNRNETCIWENEMRKLHSGKPYLLPLFSRFDYSWSSTSSDAKTLYALKFGVIDRITYMCILAKYVQEHVRAFFKYIFVLLYVPILSPIISLAYFAVPATYLKEYLEILKRKEKMSYS